MSIKSIYQVPAKFAVNSYNALGNGLARVGVTKSRAAIGLSIALGVTGLAVYRNEVASAAQNAFSFLANQYWVKNPNAGWFGKKTISLPNYLMLYHPKATLGVAAGALTAVFVGGVAYGVGRALGHARAKLMGELKNYENLMKNPTSFFDSASAHIHICDLRNKIGKNLQTEQLCIDSLRAHNKQRAKWGRKLPQFSKAQAADLKGTFALIEKASNAAIRIIETNNNTVRGFTTKNPTSIEQSKLIINAGIEIKNASKILQKMYDGFVSLVKEHKQEAQFESVITKLHKRIASVKVADYTSATDVAQTFLNPPKVK